MDEDMIQDKNELIIEKQTFILEKDGRFRDFYFLGQSIGKGAYAEVRKCMTRKTKEQRAVKLIRKEKMTESEIENFKEEIKILK